MKNYALIEFKGNYEDIKSVDCVPTKWLFKDENKQLKTHFLPPPYTPKRCRKFHKSIKLMKEPSENWITYAVTLKKQTGKIMLIFCCNAFSISKKGM